MRRRFFFQRSTGLAWLALAGALSSGCSGGDDSASEEKCDLAGVTGKNCEVAHSLVLPEALPPSKGNAYADSEDAAHFGFFLFFDSDIGKGVGCPTCHAPELAFTDRKSVSLGKSEGGRNAPTVFNAARLSVIFWDGRGDSLWSQPLFAIENPVEMDSSRLALAHHVNDDDELKAGYEGVFGELPDMTDWPEAGKPGDAAFDDLPEETADQVNRIAANVGKSLDAYMRKDTTSAADFDRFLAGDQAAIIPAAQRGLDVFMKSGCVTCHSGPMLTDESFHAVGLPSLPDAEPDYGRIQGIPVLESNPFNLAGPYADPGPGVPGDLPTDTGEEGAFRTPSLRNIALTAPYGHDGAMATLREVLGFHAPDVTEDEQGELIAFFQTLNGDYPLPPWNNWPSAQ